MGRSLLRLYHTRKDGVWKDDKSVKNPLKNKGKFDIGRGRETRFSEVIIPAAEKNAERAEKGRKYNLQTIVLQKIDNFAF